MGTPLVTRTGLIEPPQAKSNPRVKSAAKKGIVLLMGILHPQCKTGKLVRGLEGRVTPTSVL